MHVCVGGPPALYFPGWGWLGWAGLGVVSLTLISTDTKADESVVGSAGWIPFIRCLKVLLN